jgi:predicted alpha/beta-hydrolase family hydrolase
MLVAMDQVTAFESDRVRGFLHRPQGPSDAGIVLTHGAGGNCRSPLLLKLAAGFCGAGLWVLRVDLPFRQRRPRGPPSPAGAAADRAGLRAALAALREHAPGRLYLGGNSYGGRQASLLAAEEESLAAGLLLLSYPLHPPGRPERLRTEHFARLHLKTVFVHGSRDPFGSVAELRRAAAAIPRPPTIVVVEGAGHDLKRGDFDAAPAIAALTTA